MPRLLAATRAAVQRFNDNCAKGTDDFGRKLQATAAIARLPYYALYVGGPNTSGGLYANADRQVLDWDGKPIPRLFAASEIASLFKYVGSAHLSECIVCGRTAGKNAAARRTEGVAIRPAQLAPFPFLKTGTTARWWGKTRLTAGQRFRGLKHDFEGAAPDGWICRAS